MALNRTLNLSIVYLVIWLISRDLTLIQAARVAMVKKQTGLTDGEMLAEKRDLAIEDKDSKNANKQEHIISEVGNLKKQTDIVKTEDSDFKPLPFPVNFWFYDVNMDGQITLGELIETTGDAEDVKKAFAASDRNSDGTVTMEEYSEIPWGYDPDDVFFKH